MTITVIEMINLLESMPDDAPVAISGALGQYGILSLVYDQDREAVILVPE